MKSMLISAARTTGLNGENDQRKIVTIIPARQAKIFNLFHLLASSTTNKLRSLKKKLSDNVMWMALAHGSNINLFMFQE